MTCADRIAGADGGAPHTLLVYDSDHSLCSRAVPYIRAGLDGRETVVAVVSADVQRVLRGALGGDAARVRWQAGDIGTIGHPWACLYDSRAHDPQTLRDARQTHPRVLDHHGREVPNGDYVDPGVSMAHPQALSPPPTAVQLDLVLTGPAELMDFRRLLRGWATRHTSERDVDDVVIAVAEVVTNALRHGVPPVRVRAWTADDLARVQVHDRGVVPIPATAGYHRPARGSHHGYGLWIARQLADVLATFTDRTGTVTALDFPLASDR